jgi:23S rRNA (pseudouridine1915-N3)-methyltransferase
VKVRLISVGKDRSGLFEPGVREYASRLAHYCRFELLELPDARKARDVEQAKVEEGREILARLKPNEVLIALDERGKQLTSAGLAELLGRYQTQGSDVSFCVGGAEGLSEEVRARAQRVLGLSTMTLPHRLARLVIAEQIYRAFTLLRGEPYHR